MGTTRLNWKGTLIFSRACIEMVGVKQQAQSFQMMKKRYSTIVNIYKVASYPKILPITSLTFPVWQHWLGIAKSKMLSETIMKFLFN